jgi:hypothetical protein
MSGKFHSPLALPLVPPRQEDCLRFTAALDLISNSKYPASAGCGTPIGRIKNDMINVRKDLEGGGSDIFEGTVRAFEQMRLLIHMKSRSEFKLSACETQNRRF